MSSDDSSSSPLAASSTSSIPPQSHTTMTTQGKDYTNHTKPAPKPPPQQQQQQHAWTDVFRIPDSLKRLFDKYPLVTYAANALPASAPPQRLRKKHVLYIFATPEMAAAASPSFNPGCLKWQAYLKFQGIPFQTRASNNHASPSGALPFLQPASSSTSGAGAHPAPIPSNKLASWADANSPPSSSSTAAAADAPRETHDSAYLAPYESLITQHVRLAYLHALYLHTPTFEALARRLYIDPCTSNALVRHALCYPLRGAALEQILSAAGPVAPAVSGSRSKVDVAALEDAADDAFEALSVLLGDADWFSSCSPPGDQVRTHTSSAASSGRASDKEKENEARPGLLDAAVFAYTHAILTLFANLPDESSSSPARRLARMLQRRENLVQHCERIRSRYFA